MRQRKEHASDIHSEIFLNRGNHFVYEVFENQGKVFSLVSNSKGNIFVNSIKFRNIFGNTYAFCNKVAYQ